MEIDFACDEGDQKSRYNQRRVTNRRDDRESNGEPGSAKLNSRLANPRGTLATPGSELHEAYRTRKPSMFINAQNCPLHARYWAADANRIYLGARPHRSQEKH